MSGPYNHELEYDFSNLYSKFVQSEQSIYLKQCSNRLFFRVKVQISSQKHYDDKVR